MQYNIIETKICSRFGEQFDIYENEQKLIEKISPIIKGKKYIFDTPNMSPKAREINRLMFRNERKFYKIQLNNGKTEISTIHNEARENILPINEFYEYDFSKHGLNYSGDFLNDRKKLFLELPYASRVVVGMEKSDFCNQEAYDKNCYLNSGGHENVDSMYNTLAIRCYDALDNHWVFDSQVVLESNNIYNSQKIFFSQNVYDSFNCYFSYDLKGCQNVLFGVGIQNVKYVYKNQILEKNQWEQKYNEIKEKLKTREGIYELEKEFSDFLSTQRYSEKFIELSENVSGNNISNSKNVFFSSYTKNNNDTYYTNITWDTKDSVDINYFADGSKLYNIANSYIVNNCYSSNFIITSNNIFCSNAISDGENFFGCFGFGLNNKSYMILNKQYTKDDWEEQVVKIITELKGKGIWGEYLEPELSPFPYNDSVAYEYYPIKEVVYMSNNTIIKNEIINPGGIGKVYILESDKFISNAIIDFGGTQKIKTKWRTKETEININDYNNILDIDAFTNIDEIDNNILEKVLICKISKRPFRIVKKELEFYKKYEIAIPNIHYDERHKNRVNKKNSAIYNG